MADKKSAETRPDADVRAAENRRVVGDVNPDWESKVAVDDLADGIDDDTKDQIVYATTTRQRTTVSKRAHEPLDPRFADDDQPDEEGNGPRAEEIGPSDGSLPASNNTVSEAQVKAGAEKTNPSE